MTRDLVFACPRCFQHIECEEERVGETIACPACGGSIVVPAIPDEHHLRIASERVAAPAHAHGAPLDSTVKVKPVRAPRGKFSQLAVASFALSCGSLLLGPFGFIPGIIFGHLAKAELRRNPRLRGAKLARAGMWVGYSFLVIFLLFVGLWLLLGQLVEH